MSPTDSIQRLQRVRAIMNDPMQVVQDPGNMYEDADGNGTSAANAARMCFLAATFAFEATGDIEPVRDTFDGYTDVLVKGGGPACVAIIDAAIAVWQERADEAEVAEARREALA